jgi:RNase P/RNase MRP subunit POP5
MFWALSLAGNASCLGVVGGGELIKLLTAFMLVGFAADLGEGDLQCTYQYCCREVVALLHVTRAASVDSELQRVSGYVEGLSGSCKKARRFVCEVGDLVAPSVRKYISIRPQNSLLPKTDSHIIGAGPDRY